MLRSKLSYVLILLILFVTISCSKKEAEIQNIKKKSQELEMSIAYKEALDKLEINDTYNAAQKFLEAELLFPQSIWAPKSALMASYSYYLQNYYSEALSNLNRYVNVATKFKEEQCLKIKSYFYTYSVLYKIQSKVLFSYRTLVIFC